MRPFRPQRIRLVGCDISETEEVNLSRDSACAQELAVWFPRHFTLSTRMSLPTWSSSFLFLIWSDEMIVFKLWSNAGKTVLQKNEHETLLEYQIEAFYCAPRARKQQQARSPPDGEQLAMVLERLSTSIVQHCTCTHNHSAEGLWRVAPWCRGWRNAFCEQRRWLMWPHSRWSSLSLSELVNSRPSSYSCHWICCIQRRQSCW